MSLWMGMEMGMRMGLGLGLGMGMKAHSRCGCRSHCLRSSRARPISRCLVLVGHRCTVHEFQCLSGLRGRSVDCVSIAIAALLATTYQKRANAMSSSMSVVQTLLPKELSGQSVQCVSRSAFREFHHFQCNVALEDVSVGHLLHLGRFAEM